MNLNISKMKNQKKINLASLADYEIKKQKLKELTGGVETISNVCACRNHVGWNRSEIPRRNYPRPS